MYARRTFSENNDLGKDRIMKNTIYAAAMILMLGLMGTACDKNDGPAERAGEKIDQAAHDIKSGTKDAYENVKEGTRDAYEKTKKSVKDTAEEAGDDIEDATD